VGAEIGYVLPDMCLTVTISPDQQCWWKYALHWVLFQL